VTCLAPRAREDSVRPRRLSGASVRPLNFTVRVRNKTHLESHAELEAPIQDPSFSGVPVRARASRSASGEARVQAVGLHSAFRARTVASMGRPLTIVGGRARSASVRPAECR
jgi:hypothetical protein